MNGTERRNTIIGKLKEESLPLSASALAVLLHVSRQIIVGDIAILRAEGEDILATPRGYVLNRTETGLKHQIACRHFAEDMEDELNVIVDNGCKVLDVIVDHPVYGQLTGPLALSNRHDVSEFIRKVRESSANPLSMLTEGVHLHTLLCPDEEAFLRVKEELAKMGIVLSAD